LFPTNLSPLSDLSPSIHGRFSLNIFYNILTTVAMLALTVHRLWLTHTPTNQIYVSRAWYKSQTSQFPFLPRIFTWFIFNECTWRLPETNT